MTRRKDSRGSLDSVVLVLFGLAMSRCSAVVLKLPGSFDIVGFGAIGGLKGESTGR